MWLMELAGLDFSRGSARVSHDCFFHQMSGVVTMFQTLLRGRHRSEK